MFLLCARSEHPVDVAGDHVDFDIELSALGEFSQSRLAGGVRDDVDREMRAIIGVPDIVDGQGHAVERDRALLGNCRSERSTRMPMRLESPSAQTPITSPTLSTWPVTI